MLWLICVCFCFLFSSPESQISWSSKSKAKRKTTGLKVNSKLDSSFYLHSPPPPPHNPDLKNSKCFSWQAEGTGRKQPVYLFSANANPYGSGYTPGNTPGNHLLVPTKKKEKGRKKRKGSSNLRVYKNTELRGSEREGDQEVSFPPR